MRLEPTDKKIGVGGAIDVAVYWGLRRDWKAADLLRRAAQSTAGAEGFRRGALSIAVVGARRMSRLHLEHMSLAGPTDVLTFDLGSDKASGEIDGEIVVCADVALRRARRDVDAARAELALYVVHGVLHLAGYDDQEPKAFRRMHAREDELLERLGLGRVFARGAGD